MDLKSIPSVSSEMARLELESVLSSVAFRRSSRLTRLLRYLGEAYFKERAHLVNEYMLAVDVFDKGKNYSPTEDSLVRVEARELRRRLNEYYQDEGCDHSIQVELSKGSYALAFKTGYSNSKVIPHSIKNSSRPKLSETTLDEYSLYDDYLGTYPSGSIPESLVVLSNPWVLNYAEGFTNSPAYIAQKTISISPELEKLLQPYSTTPPDESRNRQLHPTNHQNTGIGEAFCGFHVGRLLQRLDRPIRLTQSRFLTWEIARQHPIILLGSPFMHPWTHRNIPRRGYVLHPFWIENLYAEVDEPARYEPAFDDATGDLLEDYGLITVQTSPGGHRQIVLAGITSPATQGVGEYFSNPGKLKQAHEKFREMGHLSLQNMDFQILLKLKIQEHIPIEPHLVSCRILPPV